jgi:hypothetical protein
VILFCAFSVEFSYFNEAVLSSYVVAIVKLFLRSVKELDPSAVSHSTLGVDQGNTERQVHGSLFLPSYWRRLERMMA